MHDANIKRYCADSVQLWTGGSRGLLTRESASRVKVITENHISSQRQGYICSDNIHVLYDNPFDVAKRHIGSGKTVVVHFLDPKDISGGCMAGRASRQAVMCARSNMYPCMDSAKVREGFVTYSKYQFHSYDSDRLVYIPAVAVYRDAMLNVMQEKDWFSVDMIAAPVPYMPGAQSGEVYFNAKVLMAVYKSRFKNIFETALSESVNNIVFEDMGCDENMCPPALIAIALREAIKEGGYAGMFWQIICAVDEPYSQCMTGKASIAGRFEDAFFRTETSREYIRRMESMPYTPPKETLEIIDGPILGDASRIERFVRWRAGNKYFGKQFSILGDGISTLAGFNPPGYEVYYIGDNCNKCGVYHMKDTWWGRLIDYYGGYLLVNNSWKGSMVTYDRYGSRKDYSAGCSDERTSHLHVGSVEPDVIIIYMGINDWKQGIYVERPVYDRVAKGLADEFIFDSAAQLMVDRIRNRYPRAEIWPCTLKGSYIRDNPNFRLSKNKSGFGINEYNTSIGLLSHVNFLDGAFQDKKPGYFSVDGVHPVKDGMAKLANMSVHGLDNFFEPESFDIYKDESVDEEIPNPDFSYDSMIRGRNFTLQYRYETTPWWR